MIDEASDIAPDNTSNGIIDGRLRVLLFALREALLLMVTAIEIYLCIPRSKPPTHR